MDGLPQTLNLTKHKAFHAKKLAYGTTTNSHDVIVKIEISLMFSTKLAFISTTLSHTIQINYF